MSEMRTATAGRPVPGAAGLSGGRRERPVVLHVAAVEYTAQVLLLPQLCHLAQRGYDVRLACAPDGPQFPPQFSQFRPIPLAFPRSPRPRAMSGAILSFVRAVGELKPDLVHLHTPAAALPARLLPRWLFPRRTRLVYTVHGFAHVWDSGRPRDRLLERLERRLAPRTDALLFQSQEDLRRAEELGYRSRLVYLGNGVEDDWFEIPPADTPRRPLYALFVGRLIREKGLLDLFDALERVPNVRLTVSGAQLPTDRDGVELELRERAASGHLAGRVRFTGFVNREQMRQQVADTDVLVLPSYREGVPRSLIEGMAAGRPAVATDVRGCRELVTDGETGWLAPAGNIPALAGALIRAAAASPEDYRRQSAAARALANTRYRETAVFERLVALYQELGVNA
jgi:glycosyltransferase involved in cell wall biosynthesis